jgi:hypothetical protein
VVEHFPQLVRVLSDELRVSKASALVEDIVVWLKIKDAVGDVRIVPLYHVLDNEVHVAVGQRQVVVHDEPVMALGIEAGTLVEGEQSSTDSFLVILSLLLFCLIKQLVVKVESGKLRAAIVDSDHAVADNHDHALVIKADLERVFNPILVDLLLHLKIPAHDRTDAFVIVATNLDHDATAVSGVASNDVLDLALDVLWLELDEWVARVKQHLVLVSERDSQVLNRNMVALVVRAEQQIPVVESEVDDLMHTDRCGPLNDRLSTGPPWFALLASEDISGLRVEESPEA